MPYKSHTSQIRPKFAVHVPRARARANGTLNPECAEGAEVAEDAEDAEYKGWSCARYLLVRPCGTPGSDCSAFAAHSACSGFDVTPPGHERRSRGRANAEQPKPSGFILTGL